MPSTGAHQAVAGHVELAIGIGGNCGTQIASGSYSAGRFEVLAIQGNGLRVRGVQGKTELRNLSARFGRFPHPPVVERDDLVVGGAGRGYVGVGGEVVGAAGELGRASEGQRQVAGGVLEDGGAETRAQAAFGKGVVELGDDCVGLSEALGLGLGQICIA
jgi:hypothetical protein